MEVEYQFEGRTVEKVYESFNGDYWIITDTSGRHPFGYACLSSSRQFAEWGRINKDIFDKSTVWEVPHRDWPHTGPDEYINIEKVQG